MGEDLQPHIMCEKGDVAPHVLLPGDPGRVPRMGEKLDEYREVAFNREFRTITGTYKKVPITVCSTGIGGPSAAIAIEELANLGAKVLIRVGSCGGYQPNVEIGDLVLPEGVVRADGTSKMYIPESYPAVPDFEVLSAMVEIATRLGFRYHTGISITTDAFYLKPKEFVEYWSKNGIIACEMEAATVLTLAKLKGLKAGAVLAVVNELTGATEPWKGVRKYAIQTLRGERGEEISGEEKATLVALGAITQLKKQFGL